MGVCNCSMFCCTFLYVHSSFAIILMGKRELVALLNLSSWCLVMVERLFLAVPRGCLQFVIVVFPDHTHLLLLIVQTCKIRHFANNTKDYSDTLFMPVLCFCYTIKGSQRSDQCFLLVKFYIILPKMHKIFPKRVLLIIT